MNRRNGRPPFVLTGHSTHVPFFTMTNTISPSFVSVIIPCRNEEKYISTCLNSVLAQNYPRDYLDNFEILILDGMSTDHTRAIILDYKKKYHALHYFENIKKITPSAFNIGIKHAKGGIVIFMGAHAHYQPDYIRHCVQALQRYDADVVGGILKTEPRIHTLQARAIALTLSHPLAVGGATFRTGSDSPREVDTVFGGCYKKEIFERVGLFNEQLVRSQDIEMNIRIKKAGGKILLDPSIVCTYYPKSTLHAFFKHNLLDGIWAIYPFKFVRIPLRLRHYIPLLFILCLLLLLIESFFSSLFLKLLVSILVLYTLVVFSASLWISVQEKNVRLLPFLILAFLARHYGYGIGSFFGIIKLLLPEKK